MLKSNKSIPNSLKRIVKFYRFFGFSFSGFNLEEKPKTCCNLYSIILNVFMIIASLMSGILYNILTNPLESREEGHKTILKVVLIVGNFIINIDSFASFCFSLKSGGKLIQLLDNEETHAIDNNLKIANRIFRSFFLLTLLLNILSLFLLALDRNWRLFATTDPLMATIVTLILTISLMLLLNISWYFSVIYVYITIIMRKKIQLLEDEVASGKGSIV
jgi:heme/copper-type cytochrome/quinol oxidase subunit 2